MSTRRRLVGIVGASAALIFILYSAYFGGWPDPFGDPTLFVLSSCVVAAAYLIVGHLSTAEHPDRRIGLLFSVVGYLYLLRSVGYLHETWSFAVGLATVSAYQAALAHLGLAWPSGQLRSRFEAALVVAIYTYNVGHNVLLLLFRDHQAEGCATCPENPLLVDADPEAIARIDGVSIFISQLFTIAVVGVIGWHWRTSEGYRRTSMNRLLLVAVPIAAYSVVVDLTARFEPDLPDELAYAVAPLLLLSAPVAQWVELRRAAVARAAVGQALVGLDPGPTPAALQDALRSAVGDNEIRLALRDGDRDGDRAGYRDVTGVDVDPGRLPPGRTAVRLDTRADWVMVVDAHLADEPELLEMVVAAARLALDHARMRAEIGAQLAEVRESRARIVQAADAARRKLERDLHDGAQQRLVTLSLAVGLARAGLPDDDAPTRELLDTAAGEAAAALAELRDLARGIHPAVLTESGLAGGIRALAERSPVPVTVAAVPPGRYPASVEITAYFLVAEALANVSKHAPGAAATVTIGQGAATLDIEIADDGPGGAVVRAGSGLGGLADRVAAAGGRLEVRSPTGAGTAVRARLPVADSGAVTAPTEVDR